MLLSLLVAITEHQALPIYTAAKLKECIVCVWPSFSLLKATPATATKEKAFRSFFFKSHSTEQHVGCRYILPLKFSEPPLVPPPCCRFASIFSTLGQHSWCEWQFKSLQTGPGWITGLRRTSLLATAGHTAASACHWFCKRDFKVLSNVGKLAVTLRDAVQSLSAWMNDSVKALILMNKQAGARTGTHLTESTLVIPNPWERFEGCKRY